MISYTETVCIKALAQAKQKSDWGGEGRELLKNESVLWTYNLQYKNNRLCLGGYNLNM